MLRTSTLQIAGAAGKQALRPLPHLQQRFTQTRPGQPKNLTRYDKGPDAIPVPGTIRTLEAERLGKIDISHITEPLAPRTVPKKQEDFEASRLSFNSSMSSFRKQYASEVAESEARIAAAAKTFRDGVRQRKQEGDALRAIKKASTAAATEESRKRAAEARRMRQLLGQRRAQQEAADIMARKKQWLDGLEKEAAGWVKEDKVEEMITPELFSMKVAWQYEKWFQVKEKRKQLLEEARRNKRPGNPLREIPFEGLSEAEFASDWESDAEAEEQNSSNAAVAAGGEAAAIGASIADQLAAADPTGLQAMALAAARRSDSFVEPDYDAEGRLIRRGITLGADGSTTSAVAASLDRFSKAGLQLEELYHSKPLHQILADYVREQKEELEMAAALAAEEKAALEAAEDAAGKAEEGLGATEGTAGGFSSSKDAAAAVAADAAAAASRFALVDKGERQAENAYIDYCISSRSYEALFYALLRKRGRLQVFFPDSLAGFDALWGPWLDTVKGLALMEQDVSAQAVEGIKSLAGPAAAAEAGGEAGKTQQQKQQQRQMQGRGGAVGKEQKAKEQAEREAAVAAELDALFEEMARIRREDAAAAAVQQQQAAGAGAAQPAKPSAAAAAGGNLADLDGSKAGGYTMDSRNIPVPPGAVPPASGSSKK